MATMVLNSLVESFSGKSGGFVFYRRYNTQCFREKVKPRDPDTPAQRTNREKFGDAVHSWQQLAGGEKDKFNRKARMKNMSGYNLFISMFMRTGEEAQAGNDQLQSLVLVLVNKRDQNSFRSVSSPFPLRNGEKTGINTVFSRKRKKTGPHLN